MTITMTPRPQTGLARVADPDVEALNDPLGWPRGAADLLTDLGFTLINSRWPATSGSHLLVALRAVPTLRHFDPEVVAYYAPSDGRAAVSMLDRWTAPARPSRIVLWGHVHVVDRLGIENRFLSFGGMLRSAAIDPELTVLDLWSPGPIVRWGGHSQGTDQLTGEIGAFFGRLIVPIDGVPGVEQRVDALAPEVLYSAFVLDLSARLAAAERNGAPPAELGRWLSAERRRLAADEPSWAAARSLVADLILDA
jgi:hypothetical protein